MVWALFLLYAALGCLNGAGALLPEACHLLLCDQFAALCVLLVWSCCAATQLWFGVVVPVVATVWAYRDFLRPLFQLRHRDHTHGRNQG